MFDVGWNDDGSVALVGRLDASQAGRARDFFATVNASALLDCSRLDYISSAGLGVLIATQRRLADAGHALRLRHLNQHLDELFRIAGLHAIFAID